MASILVTAATGSQGAGVVRSLARAFRPEDLTIKALVRDQESPRAKALLEKSTSTNVQLVTGDFDNSSSLAIALRGCSIIFINLVPNFEEPEAEYRQLRNVIDIFLTSPSTESRKWVIFSTVMSSGLPAASLDDMEEGPMKSIYQAKIKCHRYVVERCEQAGASYTILQPGHFFSNWLPPMSDWAWPGLKRSVTKLEAKHEHILRSAYTPNSELPCLDQTTLIGDVVTKLLQEGAEIHDKQVLPLASQNLTVAQIADAMNSVLHRHGRSEIVNPVFIQEEQAIEEAKVNQRIGSQLRQNNKQWNVTVDVDSVIKLAGGFKSLEEFLEENYEHLEGAMGL